MRILITGPQASGKTTQAELLGKYLNLPVVETGEMLRELAPGSSAEAERVKQALAQGQLVDDEIVGGLVSRRVVEADCQNGFVMDGYPRELKQLKFFDPKFDTVFYLDLPEEVVLERMTLRGRADDIPEIIKKRLQIYYQRTEPVLEFYDDLGLLIRIDGSKTPDEVQEEIRGHLK